MLKIITGTDMSNKTELIAEMAKKSVEAGKKTYIIIPDQFSLVYDRKIYDMLGTEDVRAKIFNKISIIGPNKLAERLIEKYGSSGKYCDDNARLIMMYKACKALKASRGARYYERSLSSGSFFSSACNVINELRQSDAEPDTLEAAAEQLSGTISDKLHDISQIYRLYLEQLKSHGLKDINSAVSEAVEIINRNGTFKDCDVYFDSFSSFTKDQRTMIRAIFSQASDVTAALTIGNGANAKSNFMLSPFAECINTKKQLEAMARETGHEIAKPYRAETEKYSEESPALKTISDNIFASYIEPVGSDEEKSRGVKIVNVSDPYSEAEYVFAQIRRLVDEKKYKYSEIAVISRELESCTSLLEDMAYRYDVPLFCDQRKNVSQSSPVLFINSVFENIVSDSFSTRAILDYIKSPFSKISMNDAAAIEEYCFRWSVDGDMWNSRFTARSTSDDDKNDKRFEKELADINALREGIIGQLQELKNSCRDSTAEDISLALFKFLSEFDLTEDSIDEFKFISLQKGNTTDTEISRVFAQLWDHILSAVSSIQFSLADEKISAEEYYELLRTMLSQMTVSSPPQKLSAVIAASAQHTRLSGIKATFVIGVNDGHFPKNISSKGLFSEREKADLEKAGIPMEKRLETDIQAERFSCYQALCCASDLLYVCVPATDRKGENLHPSSVVAQIKAMFSDPERDKGTDCAKDYITTSASKEGYAFFCSTPKAALHKYAELVRTDRGKAKAIKKALKPYADYYKRTDYIAKLLDDKNKHSLNKDIARQLFFYQNTIDTDNDTNTAESDGTGRISLSSTKLDSFYGCPFQYFCKHGLGISEVNKVGLKSNTVGSIAHDCLEKLLQTDGAYNPEFTEIKEDVIAQNVKTTVKNYINNSMGGDFGKNARFNADVADLENRVTRIIRNVQKELRPDKTDFIPAGFEFNLTDDSGKTVMPIEFTVKDDDGKEIKIHIDLRGAVDRIDVHDLDGNRYVRIVDYKTGYIDFKFEKIYNGLGLQMLLYMLAVLSVKTDSINPDGKQLKPAALMYMRANEPTSDGFINKKEYLNSQKKTEKEIEEETNKRKDSGMGHITVSVDNGTIIGMLDKTEKPKVTKIPRLPSEEEPVFSSDEVFEHLIKKYALERIKSMAGSLAQGEIESMPTKDGDHYACTYCSYRGACGHAERKDARSIDKEQGNMLFQDIYNEMKKEESDDDGTRQ